MSKAKIPCRAACAALAALFLTPGGSVATTSPQDSATGVVSAAQLYDAMSEPTQADAGFRESVQALLARSEVLQAAADAGVDLDRVRARMAVLSDQDLQLIAERAQRLDESLAGGTAVVISSTAAIVLLLVLILLVQAN